jgi:hypothetical protein
MTCCSSAHTRDISYGCLPSQIIIGALTPDSGEIIKAKENMKIAYLTQVGWRAGA